MPVPKLPLYLLGLLPAYHRLYWRLVAARHPFVDAWNRDHQAIFVHIPKTAGTSLFHALGHAPKMDTHAPIRAYEAVYPELVRTAFRFSVVRNPWDRFASSFYFLKSGTRWPIQQDWGRRYIGDMSFDQFARRLQQPLFRRIVRSERFFWAQGFWLAGAGGPICVDRIYRFEALEAAVGAVCARLGIAPPETMPHLRKVEKPRYRELYSAETKRIVADFYARDIALLNYDF